MSSLRQQIETYWQTYRPQATAQLPDPAQFFDQLTADVKRSARSVESDLQATTADDPDEDYLVKVGRLGTIKKQAVEKALAELAFLPPEPGSEDREPASPRVPGVAYVD